MYENPDGVKIGLEVHVQLNKLKTKVFCGCATDYHNDPPNSHVCPVCLGLPGALPVINKKAVEAAIKVGLALNCKVEEHTQFYRKNYYYPDLPKGFQITQYDFPISSQGYVIIEGEDGEHKVRITRAHMEEDPGRLVHEGTIDKSKYTLIDYNRSGMALLEVVSEPDLRSPKEARRYLDKLRNILEYLDVFDGNLEGALRVDANISIMGGQRAEIKNISSHKGAERALLYEIVRQKNVLRRGGVVVQETRHFDEAREITLSMRTKEEAHDYRYFPEPDLMPLKISGWAPAIKATLPELPDARRLRFVEQYGIKDDQAKSLTGELEWALYFEDAFKVYKQEYGEDLNPKLAAAWINDYLKSEINYRSTTLTFKVQGVIHYEVRIEYTVAMLRLLGLKKITDDNAVEMFRDLINTGKGDQPLPVALAEDYIMKTLEKKDLLKVEGDIVESAALEAINENPQAVADFKAGKEKALNSLVGAVMKKTKGRADARMAREILLKKFFDKLSSEFMENINKKVKGLVENDKLRRERIEIVKKLRYIGSKIDENKFLLDKLEKGNIGDKVGAAATFKILLKKEAFELLLSNIEYNEDKYNEDKGSFVRYRVIETLRAYCKENKLDPENIKRLGIGLIQQQKNEKNSQVNDLMKDTLKYL